MYVEYATATKPNQRYKQSRYPVTIIIAVISNGSPARAIFGMGTYPLAKTIAFGGVTTRITNP